MTTHTLRQLSKSSKPSPIASQNSLIKLSEPRLLTKNDDSNIQSSATGPSASIALINKIRAIESRKKNLPTTFENLTNQPLSIYQPSHHINFPNLADTGGYNLQKENTAQLENRLSKTSKHSSNEQLNGEQDLTAKLNPYFDKVTDQKFFDRSYRVLSGANPLTKSKNIVYDVYVSDDNQSSNHNLTKPSARPKDIKSGSVFNKLKMLKKRNIIKKLG
jgi:hypothetical protein